MAGAVLSLVFLVLIMRIEKAETCSTSISKLAKKLSRYTEGIVGRCATCGRANAYAYLRRLCASLETIKDTTWISDTDLWMREISLYSTQNLGKRQH
ncbi:hypothetical protein [Pyrobaculum aerophilum]|uniref:hypothetical protein n=1 Tax=Pyrobaculum aerophilum TaxID=13773 RepID=UPI0011C05237|nr:hypothetical protein [Pyrobaculum aerophilum]